MFIIRGVMVGLVVAFCVFGFTQEDGEFIEGVWTLIAQDPFTDVVEQTMILVEKGVEPSEAALGNRTLAIFCRNGIFETLAFGSSIYLDNKDFGNLTYRVDSGEVKTIRVLQKGKMAATIDPFEAYDIAFSGTNVVIKATAYDGDTDTAEFDTTNLGTAMAYVGCEFQ